MRCNYAPRGNWVGAVCAVYGFDPLLFSIHVCLLRICLEFVSRSENDAKALNTGNVLGKLILWY